MSVLLDLNTEGSKGCVDHMLALTSAVTPRYILVETN
jgi:hypothetical protein